MRHEPIDYDEHSEIIESTITIGDDVSFPIRISGTIENIVDGMCLINSDGEMYKCKVSDISLI